MQLEVGQGDECGEQRHFRSFSFGEEKKAEKDRRLSPEDLSDYQLLRAIDMVKALKLYSENDSGK